jgi:ABC-type amino acid transport substrate-binding protein
MDGELGIDRVIGGTFNLLGRNILAFALLALLLVLAPRAVLVLTSGASTPLPNLILPTGNGGALALVAVLLELLFSATLIRTCLSELSGGDADVPAALADSLRLFLPLIGVSVLAWLAMVLGLVLLIVPGIIAFCMFAVAVPALLFERGGVVASLQRSRELTSGHRWKILGIFILLWVVQAIASGLASALFGVALLSTSGSGGGNAPGLFGALIETVATVIEAPLIATLYIELRTAKEGGVHESLSRIFE